MTLGQRIQMLRTAAGWSQEQLAEQLVVTRQTVSKWERDMSAPDVNCLVLLSDLFGVTLEQLIRGEETEQDNRIMDLQELAEKNRRSQRRVILAVVGSVAALLGSIVFVFLHALEYYLRGLHYMLYRYMTVGEYTYAPASFQLPLYLAATIFGAGIFLLLFLLWQKRRP